MNQDTLNREWMELATTWIHEAREGVNPFRTGLFDDKLRVPNFIIYVLKKFA